jgi:hypothetical protein
MEHGSIGRDADTKFMRFSGTRYPNGVLAETLDTPNG